MRFSRTKTALGAAAPLVLGLTMAVSSYLFFSKHLDKPPEPKAQTINLTVPSIDSLNAKKTKWAGGSYWERNGNGTKDSIRAKMPLKESTIIKARNYLVARGFDRQEMDSLLRDSRIEKLDVFTPEKDTAKPKQKWTCERYEALFKIDTLAIKSVNFYFSRKALIDCAEGESGVPKEQSLSHLGVESVYGDSVGWRSAVNVFLTAVEKNKRSKFALGELAALLRLCKKYSHDPLSVVGSPWGAITGAQAIPTQLEMFDRRHPSSSFGELVSIENAIAFVFDYLQKSGASRSEGFGMKGRNYKAAFAYNHSHWYARMIMRLAKLIWKELARKELEVASAKPWGGLPKNYEIRHPAPLPLHQSPALHPVNYPRNFHF